jgi:hypothetical protein
MNVEYEQPETLTEWGWLNFGWEVYYSLLNCGFRIAPTAGTASGVHPVPLGYSRVYVHTGDSFSADEFLHGLKAGRSFVTTGPMLFATVNGRHPGEVFAFAKQESQTFEVRIESLSEKKVSAVEILVNGRVRERVEADPVRTPEGAWRVEFSRQIALSDSGWIAVRSVEPQPDGRKRFAHTAAWHVEMADRPLRPRAEQVGYLIGLMEHEIERNRGVLRPEALAEFERALEIYREIRRRAIQ